MPYEDVAAFIAKLRNWEATSALALELCILTAARSGEIPGMRWSEFDLGQKIWIVPAKRTVNIGIQRHVSVGLSYRICIS
jgi:integrase